MIIKYNNYNSFFVTKKETSEFWLYSDNNMLAIKNNNCRYHVNLDNLLKFGILKGYYSNTVIHYSGFTDFEIKEIRQYVLKFMKLKEIL